MEKPNESSESSFDIDKHTEDHKAAYLQRLRGRTEANNIPADALNDWLDVQFRNEVVPDNNIVWSRAIRNIGQYLSTQELARGFEHEQWRAVTWGESRGLLKITTTVIDDTPLNPMLEQHARQRRYFESGLMEDDDIRYKLLQTFYAGATYIGYEYFIHTGDMTRKPEDYELDMSVSLSDSDRYVPAMGLTAALRSFNPDDPISTHAFESDYEELIICCQTNTKFNEELWDAIETTAPLGAAVQVAPAVQS